MGLRAKYCDKVLPNSRRCDTLMEERTAVFRCPSCGNAKPMTKRELDRKIIEIRNSDTSSRRTPAFSERHSYYVADESLGVQFNLP
jgi:predicted RNA-binding Zn-ribbon protein involved in translation (DUF1610 family)